MRVTILHIVLGWLANSPNPDRRPVVFHPSGISGGVGEHVPRSTSHTVPADHRQTTPSPPVVVPFLSCGLVASSLPGVSVGRVSPSRPGGRLVCNNECVCIGAPLGYYTRRVGPLDPGALLDLLGVSALVCMYSPRLPVGNSRLTDHRVCTGCIVVGGRRSPPSTLTRYYSSILCPLCVSRARFSAPVGYDRLSPSHDIT